MKRLSPLEGYNRYAGDYRKDHPHLDSFMDGAETEVWWRHVEALLERQDRVVTFDAGSGDGRTVGRWVRRVEARGLGARVTVWATDFASRMVDRGRRRVKGARWAVLDVAAPEQTAAWVRDHGPADLVSAFFVLVHFDDARRFFDALVSVLGETGTVLMNTIRQPVAPELRAEGRPVTIEAWDYRADEVEAAGAAAGLVLMNRQDFTEAGEVISSLLEWRRGPRSPKLKP